MRYYLGLGSNIGRKRDNLGRACRLLTERGVRILRRSSVYQTQPVGQRRQPWFLNQVLKVETALTPRSLLEAAKAVEKAMGRRPTFRHGPRLIDIDVLLAGRLTLRARALTLPHARMADRNFVLVPLAEIAPRAVHPVFRATVRTLLQRSTDTSAVRRLGARPAGC